MKKTRRVICVLLALCMMSISVSATNVEGTVVEGTTVQPRFTYIIEVSVGLGIEPDGYSTCDTGLTLYETTHSAKINMTLQRNDGSGWEDVKTWSITDDGPNADLTKHWYVISGYDYRVKSTVYVYNANDRVIEITTEYSPVVEY